MHCIEPFQFYLPNILVKGRNQVCDSPIIFRFHQAAYSFQVKSLSCAYKQLKTRIRVSLTELEPNLRMNQLDCFVFSKQRLLKCGRELVTR